MIAYHAESFIAEAIEGVINQKVDFPIELVIGDDCSKDNTRQICEAYAEKYPDIIRVLPPEVNLGITGNTARTMGQCRGKYIAVCDGDDVWTDPRKLKKQVEFLEQHPDYGMSYSDVETVSETGEPVEDPEHERLRPLYAKGAVFFKLIKGNFINNSTVVYRREFLADHVISPDRSYQIQDHILWMHISTRSKIHFLNSKTTNYRKHARALTSYVPASKIRGNKRMLHLYLFKAIEDFDRHNTTPLSGPEKVLLFRKMLSLLFRSPGSLRMRLRILRRMPKYFPGMVNFIKIGWSKVKSLLAIPFKTELVHVSK